LTGISAVLNSGDRVPHETYMQVAGSGRCLPAQHLRAAIEQSATLRESLLRYAHAFMAQTTQTALANGRNTIIERLAPWLLMVDDRIDGSDLPLTHDLLGVMLGTARPGVTLALQELERRGWIAHRRGRISILDRKGLAKVSGSAYVPPAER
jgi:CRP-like cAMP-binding protein